MSIIALSPVRNTPTCVGKTENHDDARQHIGKHPHVRGEDGLHPRAVSS